ncbi:MAG: hypothetical protein ACNYWU_08225 [Desulfobacterales bacterium]
MTGFRAKRSYPLLESAENGCVDTRGLTKSPKEVGQRVGTDFRMR